MKIDERNKLMKLSASCIFRGIKELKGTGIFYPVKKDITPNRIK
nr:hypothetical protein [Elizabethkingia sp. ASV34]